MTNPPIEVVHLIFKTHLDIGFTDYARNVVQQYFEDFIPRAIETARTLRQEGGDQFIWTTGSWLIYEYLERADAKQRKQMEAAIEVGDMAWHGLPFTTHTELMDPSLFRFGLSLSQQLDKRFGRKTIASKMTDVPGHTRSMIPLMAEAGLQYLHLGANPASTTPDVPPVFVWKDTQSDTRLLVMYQKGAYGDATSVPGLPDAIAFAHTNDNHGPQTVAEVHEAFAAMRKRFPDAKIIASTMDAFAERLLTIESTLPIVARELGDTWIHGVGTDPTKVSQFRELSRLRREWLESGQVSADDPKLSAFSRSLMMIPEHTWGMDIKMHLPNTTNYSVEQLRKARKTAMFKQYEASWTEQRAYVDEALKAVADSPLADEAKKRLDSIQPKRLVSAKTSYTPVTDFSTRFENQHFDIGFDAETGAIAYLRDKKHKRDWASAENLLGLFRYQSFSQADYDRFWQHYIINKVKTRVWSVPDYTKPGMEAAGSVSQMWQPKISVLYTRRDKNGQTFLLELKSPEESFTRCGCPKVVTIEIQIPDDEPAIHFNVQWFEKPASRLPEALWFSIAPKTSRSGSWEMDKLGERISPLDVIRNGNRKLHAVNSGVYYADGRSKLAIETLDAPLLAPGEPSLLDFNNRQPNLRSGMHFNLFNNVWGTNFPMWYHDDARFRFTLRFDAANRV
ncbi:MAG: DUF5054 domain-containing protein [Chloroflexota bacterium]